VPKSEGCESLKSNPTVKTSNWRDRLFILEIQDMYRDVMPRDQLTSATLAIVFDGSLLLGDAFKLRYLSAAWALRGLPRSSVDFGQPVLKASDGSKSEFGVYRQLIGFVGSILLGDPRSITLSALMRLQGRKASSCSGRDCTLDFHLNIAVSFTGGKTTFPVGASDSALRHFPGLPESP